MQKNIMCNLCLKRVTHKISTLTFDSTKFEESGSKPIAKRTYRFTCENGTVFILPCISDSGNARTFVAQDILDDNTIAYYKADADKHLIPPIRSNMHIRRCILIAATFKATTKIVCAAMTVVALEQSLLHTTTGLLLCPYPILPEFVPFTKMCLSDWLQGLCCSSGQIFWFGLCAQS